MLRISIDLMKENGSSWQRKKRRYVAQTITFAECADDIALQANTLAKAKT